MTGWSGPSGSVRMFVWQNGTISDLTGANYAGYLFNKRGDMVGWRQPYTSGYQELVWRQGIFEPTGLRFAPTDFNDRDQILTQNVPQKDGTWGRPYLWDNGNLLEFLEPALQLGYSAASSACSRTSRPCAAKAPA